MNAERQKRIEEIYRAVLELPPGEREAFFKQSCGADAELRRAVESLLAFEKTSASPSDASDKSHDAETLDERERQTASLTNQRIGHYKIKQLLGEGGMGEVYLGEDIKLNRQVALKILPAALTDSKESLKRFEREAQAISALNHPNIVTIHELGVEAASHFIVMEFVDGTTLSERMECGRMSATEVLDVATQIASALSAAHGAGVIHRDIKPENVMIRPDSLVKILDFGIAKLIETRNVDFGLRNEEDENSLRDDNAQSASRIAHSTNPGMIIGTANYMSPEQARGLAVDARSDIFSFGVVLYEMLSGEKPFAEATMIDTIGAILNKEPISLKEIEPEIQPEIERIVEKCLRKEPDERYQTAGDLLLDLKDVWEELEFQKKLLISASVEGKAPKSAGKSASESAAEAKTLMFKAPSFDRSGAPESEENIRARSSAKRFAGKFGEHKLGWLGALAFFAVGLAAIGYFAYFRAKPINSVAVLPFASDGGDEYLSDGFGENLINNLSRLPHLKVIARNSSFKFRGEHIDVQDAARKLGVGAIITGRIVQRGDDLQISVELINAADNTRVWGDVYNRPVSGAARVPEEIAQAVSEQLRLQSDGARQRRQTAERVTNNPQAYQLYLNGVFFRRKNGAENIRKAIEYQNQAIALDPNFTRAYVELSINYGNLVDIGAVSPREGLPPARAAAEKSLALDDTLADAYYNVARIRKYEFDWTSAEQNFKRAIELNPNLAAAHTIYAEFLSQSGRFDEALREIKLAQELDPLRTGLVGNEGSIYYQARRFDEAVEKKRIHAAVAAENPFAHLWLANAYAARGQYNEALLSYQKSLELEETTSALVYLGRFYAQTGRRDESLAVLDRLKTTGKYVSPAESAVLYAALGDTEAAFAALEKAYAERDIQLTALKVELGYDSLRDDARFADLLRRVGLQQ